ncbi:hypothetical protein DPMN_017749 [Dreissena polymorpha]|uniref:Uncharacterized protein n=1 Tax=Dreissena polymorpha TaxID=45954 RepID=A0A9D4NF99_DREPO|nr:hypothetical protein DPMN_017749 [Dreissena polymorpha]
MFAYTESRSHIGRIGFVSNGRNYFIVSPLAAAYNVSDSIIASYADSGTLPSNGVSDFSSSLESPVWLNPKMQSQSS